MNYYEPNPCYDSNYSGFNQFQPPQFPVIHQPIHEKTYAELLAEEWAANINTQPTQYSVVHQPPQETSVETVHDQENIINSMQTFLRKFNRYSFFKTPKVLLLAWDRVSKIKDAFGNKKYKPKDIQELFRKLFNDVQNIHEKLAEYINTPSWNRPAFYNNDEDDDEEFSIPMSEIYKSSLTIITPDLLITDSLIIEDEHLDTIPKTESDKLIKSSVENLVPNLSESEGLSEELSEDLYDIESSSIISSPKFDSLLEEFFGELTHIDLIPLGINEADFDPEEEIRLVEKLLYDNSSPRDILFLEELLSNDSPSLPESESFHFDVPSSPRPPAKPPNNEIYFEPDMGVLTVKVAGDISKNYVLMPRLLPTQPTLASNEEKSPHFLAHRGFKAFQLSSKSPMMIYGGNIPTLEVPFLHFYPL
nr:hypothetical protein [Tanacetum cinerariifolium]